MNMTRAEMVSSAFLFSTMTAILKNIWEFARQSLPPSAQWSTDDMPDLAGRVVLVTGGNTGIGKATARALLQHNAKVYIACRSEAKARDAIRELAQDTGKEAIFLRLDLSDITSVRSAAQEFLRNESQLHLLFNNGGVMWPPVSQVDTRGYDLQFSTNVMGHFLLTELLLSALTKAATTASPARVINTSSGAIYWPLQYGIDFETLKDGPKRRSRFTETLYQQSKLGNVLITSEMARRYTDKNIISMSLNPGNIASDLTRHVFLPLRVLMSYFLYSTAKGALTQLWAGTAPEVVNCNGMFLVPWARIGSVTTDARDEQLAKKLWEWLEEHTSN